MKDIKEYLEAKQLQLDECEGKLKELKSKLSPSDTKANAEIDKQIQTVEMKIKEGKAKLEALGKASKEEFAEHKESIDESFRAIYTHLAMS
ncbi:conserved hypothetical protein [Arcobacter nitrofigilis DSM 7299]|uniref:Uncharacterized protein n=1 Tax=Arcobacter nitrofigilis (strain ATCC 33309 / DSM 7299 / CCUG 15893 / LMG 7604 / NCTC 12251 / CI) TaxID=572480 RepID=D5V7P7_ARCNC|nr:hypothetical protein [Arcobacter nitrofigilis]ADG94667.1 conserved hypothetical protein [Arcobacter nitrofigilis DSM 7299]